MSKLYKATILLVFLVPVALGQCEPDCTGKSQGDVVKNPLSCTNYYICIADWLPTDATVPCPPGEELNTTTPTIPSPPCKALSGTPTCSPDCKLPDCHLTCDPSSNTDLISDPLSCGVYHSCFYGAVTSTLTCTDPTPYFDGNTKSCVASPTVCCGDLCTPYCYNNVVQAPDPYDCTAFYICLTEGVADVNYHNKCPANKHFDIPSGRCVDGAECVPLCSAGGNLINVTATPTSTNTDSSITTASTSVTTTAPGGCVDQFNCTSQGAFPQCKVCDPGYFICGGPGEQGTLNNCLTGFVFNTIPDQPYCVPADSCPYDPSR